MLWYPSFKYDHNRTLKCCCLYPRISFPCRCTIVTYLRMLHETDLQCRFWHQTSAFRQQGYYGESCDLCTSCRHTRSPRNSHSLTDCRMSGNEALTSRRCQKPNYFETVLRAGWERADKCPSLPRSLHCIPRSRSKQRGR